jgi:hypothetical protein
MVRQTNFNSPESDISPVCVALGLRETKHYVKKGNRSYAEAMIGTGAD